VRIATKTFIVVLVCLIGAGISSSVVFFSYSDLEKIRYQREVSQLALRDADNFRTVTSQWFVTIDLFFYEKQGYLASGIKTQAIQMLDVLNVIQSYNNSKDEEVFSEMSTAIQSIHDAVDKASILRDQEGTQWNQYINLMDEDSGIIIDDIETLYERYEIIAKETIIQYEEKNNAFLVVIWVSIGIYLFFVFASWFWASKNISQPVETLTKRTKEAKTEATGLSFILEKGSKEVIQLSRSFQDFYDRLYLAKQKSEKRKKELQESVDQLTEARLQLVQSEKLASVGQLASGVAHEINNPIGSVSSNFNTLKSYAEDLSDILEKQNECIEKLCNEEQNNTEALKELSTYQAQKDVDFIVEDLSLLLNDSHTSIERVKKIVSDLLEFSHVNSPNLTQVNINQLLEKTINLIDKNRLEKISLRANHMEIPEIVCHGGKIGQALMNVLLNAVEAINRKVNDDVDTDKEEDKKIGIIQSKTFVQGEKIYIEIQDNGCGIEQENLSRIFDPFYTTKSIGDGTGLGLHITQSIMDNHNGNIIAISKMGVGTKLRIELPIKAKE
jgi:signal transduction histidine kinase